MERNGMCGGGGEVWGVEKFWHFIDRQIKFYRRKTKKKKITVDLSAKYPSSRPLSVKALKYFLIRFLKALHKTGSKQKKKICLRRILFLGRLTSQSLHLHSLRIFFLLILTPLPPLPPSLSLSPPLLFHCFSLLLRVLSSSYNREKKLWAFYNLFVITLSNFYWFG